MKLKNLKSVALILFLCLTPMRGYSIDQHIHAEKNDSGILVKEGNKNVLFYQQAIKSKDGKYGRANYVHPLYGLEGEILTEDFPEDHLHHRGIFWAWHQIYINDQRIADSWGCKNFISDVRNVTIEKGDDYSILKINVLWKSPLWKFTNNDPDPFIRETVHITVFKSETQYRLIDFKIILSSLVEHVKLSGSNDEKGYGGFSVRSILPQDILFTSNHQPMTPQNTSILAGPWMDFSGSFKEDSDQISGITILTHPQNPGFPERWILRGMRSMQNVAYPGRNPILLHKGEDLVLKYRLVVHRGGINSINIDKIYQTWSKE
jgi:hypothetical protein